jgi:GGDEF domain-containing protein
MLKKRSRSPSTPLNASRSAHRVSFRTRQLERYIPLALAGITALALIFTRSLEPSGWAAVVVAMAIGAWSRAFPAQHQAMLSARAVCLLLCAALLYLQGNASLGAQLLLMWTLATLVGYAILAQWQWALPVAAYGVLQYGALTLLQTPASWTDWAFALCHLLVWPYVALVFGRSNQRSDASLEHSLIDQDTGLYTRQGLFTYGEEVMARYQSDGQPLSLVLIVCRNIEEVGDVLGAKILRKLLGETVNGIATSVELVGNSLAARFDTGEFVLLLPGADANRSKALLSKKFGDPPHISLSTKERKIRVMLDTAVVVAGKNEHTIESLYAAAQNRLERKQNQLALRENAAPGTSLEALKELMKDPPQAESNAKSKRKAKPSKDTDFGNIDSEMLSRLEANSTLPMPFSSDKD